MQPENDNENILVDASIATNDKLEELNNSSDAQVEGISKMNDSLDELNSGVDILIDKVGQEKPVPNTKLSFEVDGAEVQIIEGPKGDKGDIGERGIQGELGVQGERGKTGAKGDIGDQGIQGIQGLAGMQGFPGKVGSQGESGEDGKNGTDGKDAPEVAVDKLVEEIKQSFPVDDIKKGIDETHQRMNRIASKTYGLTELEDTSITNPTSSQVLSYNSTLKKWVNSTATGGGGSDTLADVTGRGATTATQSTFSGGLLSGLGTAALPSYSFSGDVNTGMWSPTADTIAWSTVGVERIRINSSGNVGIGTSNPLSNLQIDYTNTSQVTPALRINTINTGTDAQAVISFFKGASTLLGTIRADGNGNFGMESSGTGGIDINYNAGTGAFTNWGGTTVPKQTLSANGNTTIAGVFVGQGVGNSSFVGNLGIGTTSPSARIHAISTTEQLRVGFDTSIYWNATTAITTGVTTFDAVGGTTPMFVFSDDVRITTAGTNAASVATLAGTQTLSGKRITRRVVVVTQAAAPVINTDNGDIAQITGLAQAITSMTTNLTGTPAAGDYYMVQITDNGTARPITWGASFASASANLPTTTEPNVMLRVGLQRNNANTLWDCIAGPTSAGGGDMVLASTQTNTGAKTFNDTTLLLRNAANTFNGSFTNANTANRVYTLPNAAGTVALTSNITSGLVTVGNANADYLVGDYADIGAAINAAYAALASAGGGIFVKAGSYTYSTPIVFGTNGKIASLYGAGSGGTFLIFSPTTGNGVTVNSGNPTGHLIFEIAGITFMGSPTLIAAAQTNTRTNVGIFLGGGQGCPGIHVHDCTINGFGTQIEIGANAYMLTFTSLGISGGNGVNGTGTGLQGSLVHINASSNSGERNVFTACNFTDPGNSAAGNSIYFEQQGVATTFFNSCSFDNMQVRVLGSNGLISFNSCHVEDAAFATYGEYIPFYFDSAESNYIYFSGLMIADSSTNAANNFQTIISHGVNLRVDGWHLENYGGQTVGFITDHRLNNGSSSEYITGGSIQGGGLTNISVNWAYTPARAVGAHAKYANSWPTGIVCNSNNTVDFKVGNNVNGLILNENGDATVGRNLTVTGTVDVGHASDTTLSRSAAGVLAVEGVVIPTISSTNTFTGKRVTKRIQSVTSSATVTHSWDNHDQTNITAQAVGLTLANPSGTPTDGQAVLYRLKDNATAQSIAYGTQFRSIGVTLPIVTVISKTLYVGGFWNAADSMVDVTAFIIEA